MRFHVVAAIALLALGGQHVRAESAVLFNEILYHPATNEAALEWVELYNAMSYDMDVSAWRLDGAIAYTFPTGTLIRTRGFAVVALWT